MQDVASYKDLIVWKKAVTLASTVYTLTENFPKEETYGLTSQMRRCAVSIPSNIAEGSIRGSKKDFCHFLRIASGSVAELETQIEISKTLPFGKDLRYEEIITSLMEINKMIHGLIGKLKE